MAEADSNPQQPQLAKNEEEQRLRYLDFVQVAAFHAVMYAAKLYSYAKENSGPLKPGVDTVEGTVKTVVGPIYDNYHDVPVDVLKFVDRKVDESMSKVQSRVPPTLKQVSSQAFEAAAAARCVMLEVKNCGVVGSASGLAKTVYDKCEPAAGQYAASVWRSLNQLPLFPRVVHAVGPTASYYSDKYNQTVEDAAEKGYKLASHLPLLPTQRIAKLLS